MSHRATSCFTRSLAYAMLLLGSWYTWYPVILDLIYVLSYDECSRQSKAIAGEGFRWLLGGA